MYVPDTDNTNLAKPIPIPIPLTGPKSIPIPIPILSMDRKSIPIPIPILGNLDFQYQNQYQYWPKRQYFNTNTNTESGFYYMAFSKLL